MNSNVNSDNVLDIKNGESYTVRYGGKVLDTSIEKLSSELSALGVNKRKEKEERV